MLVEKPFKNSKLFVDIEAGQLQGLEEHERIIRPPDQDCISGVCSRVKLSSLPCLFKQGFQHGEVALKKVADPFGVFRVERNGVKPQLWVFPLIYLSIPWAFAIHTVTAFLYCGLPGKGLWLTAIMAPRFLASAFSSGPAFLILLSRVEKVVNIRPGKGCSPEPC